MSSKPSAHSTQPTALPASGLTRRAALAGGAALMAAAPFATARAREQAMGKCVLELFTSQACPKCPPANRLLGELAQDPNLIALSMPVDIWDFIGWKEDRAMPAFSRRQMAYSQRILGRQPYTPQLVLNGRESLVGGRREEILGWLEARNQADKPARSVPVTLRAGAMGLHVDVAAAPQRAPAAPATVSLFAYRTVPEFVVDGGPNRGKPFSYTNAVFSIADLGPWDGTPATFDAVIPQDASGSPDGIAVLVQGAGTGVILGAEQISLG